MFVNELAVKKTIAWRYHIYFWGIYFLINFIRWGSYFDDYAYSFASNLVEFPLHIIIVYFNVYYLMPKFIYKKKYTLYVISLVLLLGVHYIIRSALNYWLVTENIWPEAQGTQEAFGINHMVAVVIGELYVLGITAAIKFTVDFINERNQNQNLRELQFKTELKYLKAQMQPHFFFNTLNNLYALTLKKSEQASDVVLRLSDIMQYVIYDASKKKLPLIQEINYIDNYIELEKLRYGNDIFSEIDIDGDIDDVKIPPLLFLPFIENCFKHGVQHDKKLKLNVFFTRNDDELIFKVENNMDRKDEKTPSKKGGIGLKNMRRRLEILYKDKFDLKTNAINDMFVVTLKIPIQ
ncbi:sensor histidine kinase [Galbibacter mesophilus]|uniref:sensor histidine kinase n=1 Tax=Galbibacter mesophilus TaxID=379069 RepID=UPI00191D04C9|nr:histidine kinase [Galbibacter mesophilus]MCM5661371.1 histidine kinase [Galbibacter mesophilus]